jgi:2-hydroxy-3-oxopropionate reductase
MQAKDLAIVLETAHQYGIPLPSASIDSQLFNAMVASGNGELDNSGVISVVEALAGTSLSVEQE